MSRRRSRRTDQPLGDGFADDTRVLDQAPQASAELCPEDAAWVESMWVYLRDAGSPVSRSALRRYLNLRRGSEASQRGERTILRRGHSNSTGGAVSRSVPVDAAVGELVAARLS
ncbi:MAG: hypothetical protein QM804_10180 [Propionicimonas sp.]